MRKKVDLHSVDRPALRDPQSPLPNELQSEPVIADEDALEKLKRENAVLRAALTAVNAPEDMDRSKIIPSISTGISSGPNVTRLTANKFTSSFQLNDLEDTKYAHKADDFDGILHVFHQEWLGIRAAAGSLPGQKLAISVSGKLTRVDVKAFFGCIDAVKAKRFVFHGMSENAAYLIQQLANAGFSEKVYLVYHGNVSQWCNEPERQYALKAIEIVRRGHARRIHLLKKDHCMVEGRSFTPMLLNMSPIVSHKTPDNLHIKGHVLLPGTDDWRKNLHCNALGAAMSRNTSSIIHYTKNIQLPFPHFKKLRHTNFVDRSSTLRLMALCMCSLNVSLVECHPMVNLESEAVGTPCLRGPLNLDVLEDHPYVRLANVSDPTNPFEIRDAIDRVATVPNVELQEMISNYLNAINQTSVTRYREFLEL